MEVYFKTAKLNKALSNPKERAKLYGAEISKAIGKRLNNLDSANNLKELLNLPGGFHPLIGNKKGEWACSISKNYRLIFEPDTSKLPDNYSFEELLTTVNIVIVLRIEDYH